MTDSYNKIVITGYGIISSLGEDAEHTLQSLIEKRHGIGKIRFLKTKHQHLPVAEIPFSTEDLSLGAQFFCTRTSAIALKATREAIKMANLSQHELLSADFFSGTTVGGMDTTELHTSSFLRKPEQTNTTPFLAHDAGHHAEQVCKEMGIQGFISTCSTACSSGANAIMMAAKRLLNRETDVAIAGGSDALSAFTLNGFSTLLLTSNEFCTPFDENRKGLNLGEGAAYLVLEREENALKNNRPIFAVLSGWANTCDAYHQTASSPDGRGATASMQQALEKAALSITDIHYINAHGTATPNNDLSESVALKNVFGASVPFFSSTKSYTGHTLAASGAIEAVISILSLQHKTIFPNLHFKEPIAETGLKPVVEVTVMSEIKNILSNSFGFGGNCTSLIFSKHE